MHRKEPGLLWGGGHENIEWHKACHNSGGQREMAGWDLSTQTSADGEGARNSKDRA